MMHFLDDTSVVTQHASVQNLPITGRMSGKITSELEEEHGGQRTIKLLGISFVGGAQVFTFIEGQLAFSWCVLHCCIGPSVWRSRAWGHVLKNRPWLTLF